MIQYNMEDYFHDLRQEMLADSEESQDFLEAEFALNLTKELIASGIVDGFDPCHYRSPKGIRVDGYWFREEESALDLFIVDFENRETIESLTQTNVTNIFKRVENFFVNSTKKRLFEGLEETSQGYGLSRDIFDRQSTISTINYILISERNLSERLQTLDDNQYGDWIFSYNIWDISRFYRLQTSKGAKEDLIVDFSGLNGKGLKCLEAHLNNQDYESYLLVMPGALLANIYGKYGSRLLEQNVRCFLQYRGNVNKGIRATIMNDPGMFFAYNNGITATAKKVITERNSDGLFISRIEDLQIVNGGQTTASVFHTNRKDKAALDQVFVPMKLSVIEAKKSDEVVPKISQCANTQNKVNAADFFSNHPFHIRMEEFSRRLWAPPQKGVIRETKWFYERARGQYLDAQSKLSNSDRKKFQAEHPKSQMITKTDLAKFENVWDDKPTFVNLGSQKNFAKYAARIGKEWDKNPDRFNEFYYKCVVARAILFKSTEKIVSAQSWYEGGYRANIVAYTLAMISEYCKSKEKFLNLEKIWDNQSISQATIQTIEFVSKIVADDISKPSAGVTNISEWCKKDICWNRLKDLLPNIEFYINHEISNELISKDEVNLEKKDATKTQKIENSIHAQIKVLEYSSEQWACIFNFGKTKDLFTPKELSIIELATMMPAKIPSPKQSLILLEILEKARLEGIELS